MRASYAASLINELVFLPEWKFEAEPFTKRFENSVKIKVTYQARNSDRDHAPDYVEWIPGGARASFCILVGDCLTPGDVVRKLIDEVIMPIYLHETREFLRYAHSLDAPFHPHRLETMYAWGTPSADLAFGLA